MRKYKVYGITLSQGSGQIRAIVATKTKKRACELFGISYNYFINYGCETYNDKELKIALKKPEVIFYREIYDWTGEYKKLESR